MFATLPMYDWPEVHTQTDALWDRMRDALRREGLTAPDALDRTVSYNDSWTRPDLILGEACGLPFIRDLADQVTLIGALDLGLPDCAPGHYYSHIIVSKSSDFELDDLYDQKFAYNTICSQSGLASLKGVGLGRGEGVETGSHRASIQAVAQGDAAYAAIDARTWQIACVHEPACRDVRIIAKTNPTPGPVYIAAKGADAQTYRRALKGLMVETDPDAYQVLL